MTVATLVVSASLVALIVVGTFIAINQSNVTKTETTNRRETRDITPSNVVTVDWIIVGGGAAGAPIAYMLTNNSHFSAILLEAGQYANNDPILVQPAASVSETIYGPQYFWQGNTLPDASIGGLTVPWSNGRVLGGGTSVFGMVYTRGTCERFDEWTAVSPYWSCQTVYDTYKEMENFYGNISNNVHGKNGKMVIRLSHPDSSLVSAVAQAFISASAIGSVPILDYNDPNTPTGYNFPWQYFQFPDQTRGSTARAWLGADVINANGNGVNGRRLTVDTQTVAVNLQFNDKCDDKGNQQVTGVTALNKGQIVTYKANKGYILSMGFNTPAFLQVNGIGPASVLQKAGVPVRVNLTGVGQGYHDNPYIVGGIMIPPPGAKLESEAGTFQSFGAILPDQRPGYPTNIRRIQFDAEYSTTIIPGLAVVLFIVQPLRLQSTGSANIQDQDPLKIPLAELNFLSNADDQAMVAAFFTKVMVPVIQNLSANGYILIDPPSLSTFTDPASLTSYIASSTGNTHHYQCFNKMGSPSQGGVVDDWGLVHGTNNLYAIDDGMAPVSTDGNTGATAMMLGYRCAKHLLSLI